MARFLVDFCPGTGLRPREVRLQEFDCIDLREKAGIVCHPKGEGKFASPHRDSFVIDIVAEQALRDFLPERERFLDGEGTVCSSRSGTSKASSRVRGLNRL